MGNFTSSAKPALSAEAKSVLRVLVTQAMDGYSAMERTGLERDKFELAVGELLPYGIISVKGAEKGPKIGESYFYVGPTARGQAQFLLGNFSF
jgi:hypothetical protein